MRLVASRHPERYRRLLKRLRDARLKAGLTQTAVAERLGVPQNFVSKVERGERRIDPTELEELARLYGKRISFFFDE